MCGRFRVNATSQSCAASFCEQSNNKKQKTENSSSSSSSPSSSSAHPAEEFDVKENVGPGSAISVVITQSGGQAVCKTMVWGLIPGYERSECNHFRIFNCRSESATEKKSFKNLVKTGRTCLVVLSGFYEWSGSGKNKKPFYITLENNEPLICAGLYDYNSTFEKSTFTILTTDAPSRISSIHSRCPIVMSRENADRWLRGNESDVVEILKSETLLATKAVSWPVTKEMGKMSYQEADCSKPLEDAGVSPQKQTSIASFFGSKPSSDNGSASKKRARE